MRTSVLLALCAVLATGFCKNAPALDKLVDTLIDKLENDLEERGAFVDNQEAEQVNVDGDIDPYLQEDMERELNEDRWANGEDLDVKLDERQDTKVDAVAADISPVPIQPVYPTKLELKKFSYTDRCIDNSCCDNKYVYYNLASGYYTAAPQGISLHKYKAPAIQKPCSLRAQVKVTFEPFTERPCNACMSEPFWGRRMLKVDMYLSEAKGGFLFGIADSPTSNGYGGDGNTNQYDVEIDGNGQHVNIYPNDVCRNEKISGSLYRQLANVLLPETRKVTVYIANGYFRIVTNKIDESICSKCLFGVNGQTDTNQNNDVYITFNSASNFPGTTIGNRAGYGVCAAKMAWVCPKPNF